ncbi:hypothetical protein FB446DRAFT_727942 [Lentinula raphanica]|nr:hypothetical protein FB446DRAFT_727942 [Lentinula raphanica]
MNTNSLLTISFSRMTGRLEQPAIDAHADAKPARRIRSIPSVTPSQRLKKNTETVMQVDVPEWRPTLEESLKCSGIRIVADTLDYDVLMRRPAASGMNLEVAMQKIGRDAHGGYQLYAAIKKTLDLFEAKNIFKNLVENDPQWSYIIRSVAYQLLVDLGAMMMDRISGHHFTTFIIDPCVLSLATDSDSKNPAFDNPQIVRNVVDEAKWFRELLELAEVDHSRIVFDIPATKIGVLAASILEREGIHTNLCMISGLMHAITCAKMRPYCITIDVASILSWYEKTASDKGVSIPGNLEGEALLDHPGIVAIQSIVRYYQLHSIPTKIAGRNFRTVHELSLLGHEFFALFLSQDMIQECRRTRLPFYLPRNPSDKPLTFDHPKDSLPIASQAALAAPPFPQVKIDPDQVLNDPDFYKPNFDWLNSDFSTPHPAFPSPDKLFSSITLGSLDTMKRQSVELTSRILEELEHQIHLRVTPPTELYDTRCENSIWNDFARYYGCTPPPSSSRAGGKPGDPLPRVSQPGSKKKKQSLQELGKGLPASNPSSATQIVSPKPRRPLRRPSSRKEKRQLDLERSSTPSPESTSGKMIDAEAQTIPEFASDEEITRIIALTFGANLLNVRGTEEEQAHARQEMARLVRDAFATTSSLSTVGTSTTPPRKPSQAATSPPAVDTVELSKGKQQVLAFNAALEERTRMKEKENAATKDNKTVGGGLVEGVDYF